LSSTSSRFEPECRAALDGVRAALLELYAAIGADAEAPQEVARRFGVNKTLAWNVSRVISASDPLTTITSIPGASAFRTLLAALERHGADPAALQRARVAIESFDATVTRHIGDRSTLELIIDGSAPDRADYLSVSRKLAFRGNSGLLGVQARTRLMAVFMAPCAEDAARIDIAIVRGFIGLRRLRSEVRWPIFQLRGWGLDQDLGADEPWESIEMVAGRPAESPLIRSLSTIGPSDIESQRTPTGLDILLGPGPVGNEGAIDCFVGDMRRSATSKFRTARDLTGEFGATISAPTERLIFDLVVHEALDFALAAEVRAFLGIFGPAIDQQATTERVPLSVPKSIHPLPGRPPVVATPSVPRYAELLQLVGTRMGWSFDHFRAARLDLSHPPLGSTILLRFNLPEPPGEHFARLKGTA